MKYVWYKYKQIWAGGVQKDWHFINVPSEMTYMPKNKWIKEMLKEQGILDTQNEHYRNIIIKPANIIPIKIIQDKIRESKSIIKDKKEELKWLKEEEEKVKDWMLNKAITII